VKVKFFVAILLITCVVFTSGCAATMEYKEVEIPDITDGEDIETDVSDLQDAFAALPFPEPHAFTANELVFLSALDEVGLNWEFSERHRRSFYFPNHHQMYIITCPSGLILGLVEMRKHDEGSHMWGEKYLRISFYVNRAPTEDEFNRLQQEGLLTDDEWTMFWELAEKLLDEEDCVAGIAERARAYLEDFPFYYETEHTVIIMEGYQGSIDYNVAIRWQPFLERYADLAIILTVGLSEFDREHRRTTDWLLMTF